MTLWNFHVDGELRWCLREDATHRVPLSAASGCSLLTPFGAATMLSDYSFGFVVKTPDGFFHITTDRLVLDVPEALACEALWKLVGDLLAAIRAVTLHPAMPRSGVAMWQSTTSSPTDWRQRLEDSVVAHTGSVRDYLFRCAITEATLTKLGTTSPWPRCATHTDLMLDAIGANILGDHRRALLFAAMAVESCARSYASENHASALGCRAPIHRVVSLLQTGGAEAVKDPVYEVLAGTDNFGRLLHEIPLYLCNRSLLLDRPDVYRRARQLYTTRNKLAHVGEVSQQHGVFSITQEGAKDGLDAAIEVLQWLGDMQPYVIYKGFLSVNEGGDNHLMKETD